jgi:hypothetical protein
MIQISNETLNQFQQQMNARYYSELARILREESQQLVAHLDDSALHSAIAAAVPKALAFGIERGRPVLAFVGLWISTGPRFAEEPEVKRYMLAPFSTPDEKMDWLFKRVVEKVKAAMPGAHVGSSGAN